ENRKPRLGLLDQPARLGLAAPTIEGLYERNVLAQPMTVSSPLSPSTRTRVPSAIRSVASRVPTNPGIPYSRETIAACESRPPASVTIAPRSGRRMLNASVVDSVTSTSPCAIRANSDGSDTRRAGPSYTPRLAASPFKVVSVCSSSELPNIESMTIPVARMTRAAAGGSPDGSGGGAGGAPGQGGRSLARPHG